MKSIWTRIFAVLVLAWLVTAVPIPVPAITAGDTATNGVPATLGVGMEPGPSNGKRVAFGAATDGQLEPKLPASDNPRFSRTNPAIRLPAGATSPSRSSLPTVEYEGGSLKAPDSVSRINAGPANSDWEMARLLENRPLNAQTSQAVMAMTSDLPEYGSTLESTKPIMTLSGKPELDSAALSVMTGEGVPFYVENGQGKIWEFKTGENGGFVFTSALGESALGVPDAQEIEAALAQRRSTLSDVEMSRLLAARPQSVYPSDELSRRVNNLPIFKQRRILTLSGNFQMDSTALAAMTQRGQPFYVVDGKGNVGAFVGNTGSSEGLVYRGQLGEDTRQGVMQAVEDGRLAAETSVAAASSRGLPPSTEAPASARQVASPPRAQIVEQLPQPEANAFLQPADGSAVARGTAEPQAPRFRLKSPLPRTIVPQPGIPNYRSWRTYVPFFKDPVQEVTSNMPKLNGVPILKYIGDNQLRRAATNEMYKNGGSFFMQHQDGSITFNERPVPGGSITVKHGAALSEAMQQEIRQALAKPNTSWWSRLGESTRNSLGSLSSSFRQYFHGA